MLEVAWDQEGKQQWLIISVGRFIHTENEIHIWYNINISYEILSRDGILCRFCQFLQESLCLYHIFPTHVFFINKGQSDPFSDFSLPITAVSTLRYATALPPSFWIYSCKSNQIKKKSIIAAKKLNCLKNAYTVRAFMLKMLFEISPIIVFKCYSRSITNRTYAYGPWFKKHVLQWNYTKQTQFKGTFTWIIMKISF